VVIYIIENLYFIHVGYISVERPVSICCHNAGIRSVLLYIASCHTLSKFYPKLGFGNERA